MRDVGRQFVSHFHRIFKQSCIVYYAEIMNSRPNMWGRLKSFAFHSYVILWVNRKFQLHKSFFRNARVLPHGDIPATLSPWSRDHHAIRSVRSDESRKMCSSRWISISATIQSKLPRLFDRCTWSLSSTVFREINLRRERRKSWTIPSEAMLRSLGHVSGGQLRVHQRLVINFVNTHEWAVGFKNTFLFYVDVM